MKLFYPEYYKAFTCIAAACEDSCCKEWEVDVDAQSAAYYRQLPGELGQRLREVLRQEDGCTLMTIEDGRCPMWQQDGLCRIQAQYGHDALCQTCRQYPRLRHEYGSFTELDLELSCPEAARLIFSGSQKIITESVSGATAPEYDQAAMETLLRSRQEILTFLNSDTQPLPRQMAVVLLYAHSVQAELDGGNEAVFNPASALEFLELFNGYVGEEVIYVYSLSKGSYENIEYSVVDSFEKIDYVRIENVLCSSLNQTVNDMLSDSSSDEQALCEALSNYYYANNESFDGLYINTVNQERFDKLKESAISYYKEG